MQESYLLGNMNTFMRRLAERMSSWMGIRLPKISDKWWDKLVYRNLSPLQRDLIDSKNITELSGLDLAALLRVFDRNWFVIKDNWFMNPKYRQQIKDMMKIRNDWAHLSTEELSKEKVIADVGVIIELMSAFDAKPEDTRDMEAFVLDVKSDKNIQDKTSLSSASDNLNKINWNKSSDSKPQQDKLLLVFPGEFDADFSKYFESNTVINELVLPNNSEEQFTIYKALMSDKQYDDPNHHVVPYDGFYYNDMEGASETPLWIFNHINNIEYWAYVTDPFDDETVGSIKWVDASKSTPQRDRLVLAAIDCKLFDAKKNEGIVYYKLDNYVVTQLYYQAAGDYIAEELNDGKFEYEIAMENGFFYNSQPHGVSRYTEFHGIVDYWVYIDEPYLE